ncbi:protein outspread-like isoform X2 [Ornithodoros turicata]|uniref:protein outspread-like isoform X2 n=1 Tax=Ornithodoros turicata TaxID=34597 RepID=UPI0031395883
MSSALKTVDCRKFAPNIFNKSKCQNCFRTKDAHSAEALESNRATRKVSKCGYLFVAPDWDFSQAINRTRRWQRRWFVLYDDGELTYSVDEHPDTVPQAVIDMNKVLEVASAEDVTGNQFSIAITAPEKVHFVKGTSRDESRWWFDVLSRFPGNMVRTKNKRNATLPGLSISATIMSCEYKDNGQDHLNVQYQNGQGHGGSHVDNNNALNSRRNKEENGNITEVLNAKNGVEMEISSLDSALLASDDNAGDPLKGRSRRYLKRESRGLKSQRSRSDGVAKMIPLPPSPHGNDIVDWAAEVLSSPPGVPQKDDPQSVRGHRSFQHNPLYLLLSDVVPSTQKSEAVDSHRCLQRCRSAGEKGMTPPQHLLLNKMSMEREVEKAQNTPVTPHQSPLREPLSPTAHDGVRWQSNDNLNNNHVTNVSIIASTNGIKRSYITSLPTAPSDPLLPTPPSPAKDDHMGRGVPDGCGLDSSSVAKIEAPLEDIFVKKGWLMRLGGSSTEWFKHWFVLRNSSLTYYSDPSAEDSGILNGVLDLQMVREVRELDLDRGYAFSIILWEEKKEMVLCAVTAGIRNNWIQAIRQAVENWNSAHLLKDPTTEIRLALVDSPARVQHAEKEDLEELLCGREDLSQRQNEQTQNLETSSSDDHSEYFSIVDDEDDMADQSSRNLPPSPPLNRTAISRVKEKARSRSNSRSRRGRKLKSPQRHSSDLVGYTSAADVEGDRNCDRSAEHIADTLSEVKQSIEAAKTPLKARNSTPESTSSADTITRSNSTTLTVTPPSATSTPRSSTSSQKATPTRSSRRSASLRDLRAKKLETRCTELEEQLRLKQKELEWLQGLCEVPPSEDRLLISLNELSSLFIQSVEKLQDLKRRLDRLPEKDSSYSSARDLCRWCNDLESVITENEQRIDKIVESLHEVRASGSTAFSGCELKLQQKVIKAIEEIAALKRKLKEAQDNFDDLELRCVSLRQNARNMEEMYESQLALMTARVDDLTSKLTLSERNQRQMKQKLVRADSKQEKRRLSLKGKEALTLTKELEAKLTLLEQKINTVEESLHFSNDTCSDVSATEDIKSPLMKAKRRLSQESLPGGDQQGILLRVHLLDQKVKSVSNALEKPGLNAEDIALLSKPRICLQTKKAEDGSQVDDYTEEWSTLSLATSMNDLQAIDDAECIVSTSVECAECLAQKVDALVGWLRGALQSVYNHEMSGGQEARRNPDSKSSTMMQIMELIDSMSPSSSDNVSCMQNGLERTWAALTHNLTLLQEISCALCSLRDSEKDALRSLIGNVRRIDRVLTAFESAVAESAGKDGLTLDQHIPSLMVLDRDLATLDDEEVTVQLLTTSLETALKNLDALSASLEQYRKSRQAVLLKRLSNALDASPVSDEEPDAFQNATEQESLLALITETVSKVSTGMGRNLDKVLFLQSSLSQNQKKPLTTLCRMLQQEAEQLDKELRDACISILDSYCFVGLPPAVLEREIVPAVSDLATVVSAFAVLKAYTLLLKEEAEASVSEKKSPTDCNNTSSAPSEVSGNGLDKFKMLSLALTDFPSLLNYWLVKCVGRESDGLVPTVGIDLSSALKRVHGKLEEEREVQKRRILALQERLDSAHREWDLLLRDGCPTCRQLRDDLQVLDERLKEMQEMARTGTLCERCEELQEKLLQAAVDHEDEVTRIQDNLQGEKEAAETEYRNLLRNKEQSHQAEIENLQSDLQATRRQLKLIQSEYDGRVESLQELYEQKLSQWKQGINEESVRLRYHAEIDQLRGLCERGLGALEVSHRRLVSQIEERHKMEMDRVKQEKEQALEKESQATLAALNAMQRAHQEELHREISNFKEEFVQKMKLSYECQVLHGRHEEELKAIKNEILSLSEKYSVKCLENASLEEQLEVTSHQLQEANYQVLDLLARNKQLSAHLTTDILQREEHNLRKDRNPETLQRLLMLRDSELVRQKEENAQMLHSLHLAQAQIRQLSSQCQKLSNSLQSERNGRNGEVQRLKSKLEEIIAAAGIAGTQESDDQEFHEPQQAQSLCPPSTARRLPFTASLRPKGLTPRTTASGLPGLEPLVQMSRTSHLGQLQSSSNV